MAQFYNNLNQNMQQLWRQGREGNENLYRNCLASVRYFSGEKPKTKEAADPKSKSIVADVDQ